MQAKILVLLVPDSFRFSIFITRQLTKIITLILAFNYLRCSFDFYVIAYQLNLIMD